MFLVLSFTHFYNIYFNDKLWSNLATSTLPKLPREPSSLFLLNLINKKLPPQGETLHRYWFLIQPPHVRKEVLFEF